MIFKFVNASLLTFRMFGIVYQKCTFNLLLRFSQPQCAYSTVFSSYTSERLWEGVTGPRGSSKKRARGKRRVTRPRINLNFGQQMGVGKSGMVWPGLSCRSIDEHGNIGRIVKTDVPDDFEKKILDFRNKRASFKESRSIATLKRGWSGNKFGGQSIGKPAPTPDFNFEGFDSRVLQCKLVSHMTATRGRTPSYSVISVTGNGNGLAGFAKAKATMLRASLRKSKNRAAKNLEYFDLFEGRTLWHPAYIEQWRSKILVKPMPPGYGLVCHRVIATICRVLGIKDLYARVEGSTINYMSITKGFFQLLRQQETYQQLANRQQLHVVEISENRDNVPHLLASPNQGFTRSVHPDEDLDMSRLYFKGQVPNLKKKQPSYWNLPGHVKTQQARNVFRNMSNVRLEMQMYQAIHLENSQYKDYAKKKLPKA